MKKCLLIFFVLLLPVGIKAIDLNELSFVVADIGKNTVDLQTLANTLDRSRVGLSVHLFYDKKTDGIYLNTEKDTVTFLQLLDLIDVVLDEQDNRVIPLFLGYQGPSGKLINELKQSNIASDLFYLNKGEKLPSYEDFQQQGKKVLLFSFQQNLARKGGIMYAWDYICEFPQSGLTDPYFDGSYANGNSKMELMMVRDMNIPKAGSFPSIGVELNQNQEYLTHLLNRWRMSGKKPNFIFVTRYATQFTTVIYSLNSYKNLKGEIMRAGKPMDKVYWKHSNQCITGGYFSFPYNEGDELILSPYFPGVSCTPQTLVINNENSPTSSVKFTANAKEFNEGIEAFFDFEGALQNVLKKEEALQNSGGSIVTDLERGSVLKLTNKSVLRIGSPADYNIRNNSFTVSAWVKIPVIGTLDHSIIGTNQMEFRKGMHLLIRQRRPYFGFFANDLHSPMQIPSDEWFHIVYRYSLVNGEEAIYLNGKPEGASVNHASFLGDSSLIIGQSIEGNNYLEGYIDDVGIWSRPLGDDEIELLYRGDLKPEKLQLAKESTPFWKYILAIGLGMAIVVVVMLRRKKGEPLQMNQIPVSNENQANSILLFGDFKVLNREAEDVTYLFTPKLKELFLALLLHTLKNKRGISTSDLTQYLWQGFNPTKAANNRSVTFNKLRKILSGIEGVDLQFNKGYWTMIMGADVYCDYLNVMQLLKQGPLSKRVDVLQFLSYVQRGAFLNDSEWYWLDEFKGLMSNQVVDNLLSCASKIEKKEDDSLLEELSKRVLLTDDLNENALQVHIKLLIARENKNQAKYEFEQFCKRYYKAYQQPFRNDFETFVTMEL